VCVNQTVHNLSTAVVTQKHAGHKNKDMEELTSVETKYTGLVSKL
jgi:hypothetical protein